MAYIFMSPAPDSPLPEPLSMFSFHRRKCTVDIQPYIRRISDLTTPNNSLTSDLLRSENRYNRAIPTLLCPWEQNQPLVDRVTMALTKDLADRGMGLILPHPFCPEQAVVGFWLPVETMLEPWFFLGNTVRCGAIGGGFWLLGIELCEFLNEQHRSALDPLFGIAWKLLPPSTADPQELGEALVAAG